MKRAGLWTIGIGMLFIVGILTVKQGYAKSARWPRCKGHICLPGYRTTLYLPDGTIPNPGDPTTLPQVRTYIAVAGRSIYDGQAGVSPSHSSPLTASIMYQDQHTYQDQQMGHIRSIRTVRAQRLSPTQIRLQQFPPYIRHYYRADGSEIVFVGTDPVTPMRRRFAGRCAGNRVEEGGAIGPAYLGIGREIRAAGTPGGGMRRLAPCAVERMSVTAVAAGPRHDAGDARSTS